MNTHPPITDHHSRPPLCPFWIPEGVSYDGPWHVCGEVHHQFTDRAVTMSTFVVEAKDFHSQVVAQEVERMRRTFAEAATCLGDLAHGGPVDAKHCTCHRCKLELHLGELLAHAEAKKQEEAADPYSAKNYREQAVRGYEEQITRLRARLRNVRPAGTEVPA